MCVCLHYGNDGVRVRVGRREAGVRGGWGGVGWGGGGVRVGARMSKREERVRIYMRKCINIRMHIPALFVFHNNKTNKTVAGKD